MAAITWDDVVGYAAQLAAVPVAAQTVILDHVNTGLNASLLGGEDSARLKLIRLNLAAHIGELVRRQAATSGAAGPVASKSISASSISVSYASVTALAGGSLDATMYGQEYRRMIRNSAARIGRVA